MKNNQAPINPNSQQNQSAAGLPAGDQELKTVDQLTAELSETRAELKEAKSLVEQMRAKRSEFVTKFGYEARTPMASIMGMLNLLLDTGMSEDQRRMVSSAGASAHSLLRLVDSVLDCSRIELGNLKVDGARFDPVGTIEQAIRNIREEADEKDLVLEFEHADISPAALGDGKRFRQIVENLLERAIDQTYCGGIKIKLVQEFSDDGILLTAEILDSGINGGSGNLDDVFAPFENKPSATAQEDDLVTSVSRSIAEKMGGSIRARNDDRTGPRFIFQVPLALPEEFSRPVPRTVVPFSSETKPQSDAEQRPLDLLVVDDNRINLEVARRFLAKNNCNVHLAGSGREGLKILSENYIDGILMDCQMPELSGYETVELIRSGQAGESKAEVYIVAITADDSSESRAACEKVGMNDFVAKPVRAAGFKQVVEEIRNHVSSILEPDQIAVSR